MGRIAKREPGHEGAKADEDGQKVSDLPRKQPIHHEGVLSSDMRLECSSEATPSPLGHLHPCEARWSGGWSNFIPHFSGREALRCRVTRLSWNWIATTAFVVRGALAARRSMLPMVVVSVERGRG